MSSGTRTSDEPLGNGTLDRELKGNVEFAVMMKIVSKIMSEGKYWSIGNPFTSVVWKTEARKELAKQPGVFLIRFDQCVYHLRPPDLHVGSSSDLRTLKATYLRTNLPSLRCLHALCDHSHHHVVAIG